jgi:mRNA-degrading endonuclease RelE of RelBE toxin-antitoxin system
VAKRSPHLWHLEVEKRARDQIRRLQAKERQAVFQAIRELLIAENPQRANDVRKLVEKRFEGLW